jgi:hypothetical protein
MTKSRQYRRQAVRLNAARPEAPPMKTQGMLEAADAGGKASIKVDSEGGVHATEPKSRLLALLISVLIANKSMDNDAGRHAAGGGDANISGRTLGGRFRAGPIGCRGGAEFPLCRHRVGIRMCCKYGFQVDCSRCDIAERPVNKSFQIKQIGVVLFE